MLKMAGLHKVFGHFDRQFLPLTVKVEHTDRPQPARWQHGTYSERCTALTRYFDASKVRVQPQTGVRTFAFLSVVFCCQNDCHGGQRLQGQGGHMLLLTAFAMSMSCIFGCTQSALPISSSMVRHQQLHGSEQIIADDSEIVSPIVISNSIISHAANSNAPQAFGSTSTYTTQIATNPQPIRVAYKGSTNPWKPKIAERKWSYIVLHHTAADRGSVESIHEAHLQRRDSAGKPWLGIGYHFVIGNGKGMKDGSIESTFRWRGQLHGAHAGRSNYNEHGIGICLVGNFEKYPPTKAQLTATRRLVRQLQTAYGITKRNVVGHGDLKQTACPGRFFPVNKVTQGRSVFFDQRKSQQSVEVTLAAQEQPLP